MAPDLKLIQHPIYHQEKCEGVGNGHCLHLTTRRSDADLYTCCKCGAVYEEGLHA